MTTLANAILYRAFNKTFVCSHEQGVFVVDDLGFRCVFPDAVSQFKLTQYGLCFRSANGDYHRICPHLTCSTFRGPHGSSGHQFHMMRNILVVVDAFEQFDQVDPHCLSIGDYDGCKREVADTVAVFGACRRLWHLSLYAQSLKKPHQVSSLHLRNVSNLRVERQANRCLFRVATKFRRAGQVCEGFKIEVRLRDDGKSVLHYCIERQQCLKPRQQQYASHAHGPARVLAASSGRVLAFSKTIPNIVFEICGSIWHPLFEAVVIGFKECHVAGQGPCLVSLVIEGPNIFALYIVPPDREMSCLIRFKADFLVQDFYVHGNNLLVWQMTRDSTEWTEINFVSREIVQSACRAPLSTQEIM